jgi:hypothetical protein
MKVLLRLVAFLFLAIGAFLLYAVIAAVASAAGANVPVCIAYVIATAGLWFLATRLWRRSSVPRTAATAGS